MKKSLLRLLFTLALIAPMLYAAAPEVNAAQICCANDASYPVRTYIVDKTSQASFPSTSENPLQLSIQAKLESQSDSNLPALPAPTNLKWNEIENEWSNSNLAASENGHISWDAVDGCEGEYKIRIFRNGEEIFFTNWNGLYDHNGNGRVGIDAESYVRSEFGSNSETVFSKSGIYTFSIRAIGDGTLYSDSPEAYSDQYAFVAPATRLSAPTNLMWVDSYVLSHNTVPHAGGYAYTIYDQNGDEIGSMWDWRGLLGDQPPTVECDFSFYIAELAGNPWREDPIEYIYVTVAALTEDIETYRSSAPSPKSPAYLVDKKSNTIFSALSSALSDTSVSAQDALDSFLSDMENKDIANKDIAVSMQQDDDLVSGIQQLEELYKQETGIAVSVQNTPEDDDYLQEQGIDAAQIEVVGAALNSTDGQDVSLNFSKADDSISADPLFYKNSVAVNIDMDGVKDDQKLDVPVQITMPVPTNVLPHRLVILHYHKDGSVESIHPSISPDGTYATFVLTSFSPFVFCNVEGADCTATNVVFTSTNFSCELYFYEPEMLRNVSVVAALYGENGQMLHAGLACVRVKDGRLVVSIDYDEYDYASYKLFILNEESAPLTWLQ